MPRTRQIFDEQLQQLQQRLLQFGELVQEMLGQAMDALERQDVGLAGEVIACDDRADEIDLQIEQDCMRLLALQHPMARDLRIIGTVMKAIADIERIGDYSVDIARTATALAETDYLQPLVDMRALPALQRMGELARAMLRDALQALVRGDLAMVCQAVRDDDQVDRLWRKLRDQLQQVMLQRPEVVPQAVPLLLAARYLERIADHAVNVAERVWYMETGQMRDLVPCHRSDFELPNDQQPGASLLP